MPRVVHNLTLQIKCKIINIKEECFGTAYKFITMQKKQTSEVAGK